MEFIARLDMDNAAFEDRAATELARILENIARKVKRGDDAGKIMDVNGNSVGSWEVR